VSGVGGGPHLGLRTIDSRPVPGGAGVASFTHLAPALPAAKRVQSVDIFGAQTVVLRSTPVGSW
jgi:hypothetical protein